MPLFTFELILFIFMYVYSIHIRINDINSIPQTKNTKQKTINFVLELKRMSEYRKSTTPRKIEKWRTE